MHLDGMFPVNYKILETNTRNSSSDIECHWCMNRKPKKKQSKYLFSLDDNWIPDPDVLVNAEFLSI
jgi:hypothetical protein